MLTVDLGQLAESVGVRATMFTPPIPNAKPMRLYQWDAEGVARASKKLQETYTVPGTELAFLGHVDIWIVLALAYSVEGTCKSYFASPNHDGSNTFTYVPLEELPLGTPPADIYFDYKLQEDGDRLFLEYAVDDPKAQGHTFFHDSISKLVLPEIPEGKVLCIYGAGIYPVQWAVTHTYRKHCAAVFTACHEDKAYTCAWSRDPRYQVGDQIPRSPLL